MYISHFSFFQKSGGWTIHTLAVEMKKEKNEIS